MKRALWLVLAAFVVVWGIASLDVGKRGRPSGTTSSEAQGAVSASEERAEANADVPAKAEARFRVGNDGKQQPAPAAKRGQGAATATSRAPQGSTAVIGKRAAGAAKRAAGATTSAAATEDEAQVADERPATGELGEGILSPDFVELERKYADEPRDGEWALAEEQRVRALLHDQPLEKNVVLVHCQQSVCRMVLESDAPDLFKQLLDVPGLREETSLGPQTPYSLQSGQLAIYFRRPEATAQAAPH